MSKWKNLNRWYSSEEFESKYNCADVKLGAEWTPSGTTFRVWAPTASKVWLNLYGDGDNSEPLNVRASLCSGENGVWYVEMPGNLNGIYYTFSAVVDGVEREACDPYALAVGVNGKRAMVLDMSSTNPSGWEKDHGPSVSPNEAIIYEAHIRGLTADTSSGVVHRGKFLGLAESGTTNRSGSRTCLDYISDLGITHIHLLPVFDFASVDEAKSDGYNWGYDPSNYYVPEGSYATDPYNGAVRIREFKSMVKALHDRGIGVVMDVVYNHVNNAEEFCFNKLVPGYFTRADEEGNLSNGSFCGNDTASERTMVKDYIVKNVLYWSGEYHIDGFRFDLAGLLDTDTINSVTRSLRTLNPYALLYGEGWDMPTQLTKPGAILATQMNSWQTPGFAYFNDTIRNLLRGRNSISEERGLASGAFIPGDAVKSCLMGLPYWAVSPIQVVNYVSCHDDCTLYDKLSLAMRGASRKDISRACRFAAAICFASAGIPFFQAGEELLRRKLNQDNSINTNSYNAGDAVNSINWDWLEERDTRETRDYYKGLIAFRKAHPALRLTKTAEIRKRFRFWDIQMGGGVILHINGIGIPEESAEELLLIINPDAEPMTVTLPKGNWSLCVTGERAGTENMCFVRDTYTSDPVSCSFLVRK